MKEYRELLKFKYNGKKYVMLIDNNNKYFFLHINTANQYEYLHLQTFKEICSIFCNAPHILRIEKEQKK